MSLRENKIEEKTIPRIIKGENRVLSGIEMERRKTKTYTHNTHILKTI